MAAWPQGDTDAARPRPFSMVVATGAAANWLSSCQVGPLEPRQLELELKDAQRRLGRFGCRRGNVCVSWHWRASVCRGPPRQLELELKDAQRRIGCYGCSRGSARLS